MREKNATSIEYFKDPRRIVDLLNGIVFHGRQVITEDNLLEKNPVLHNVYREKNKVVAIENTPDLSVAVTWKSLKFQFNDSDTNTGALCNAGQILHEKGID